MGSLLALVAAAAAAMTAAAAPPIAPANVSVVWHAPFFSGGGYCSEATTFVLGLAALGVPIGLEPHGDGFDQDYVAGLDDGTLASSASPWTRSGSPSDDRYAAGVADDAFVVVSVFKWEKRKGWDVLLRAWADAFARGDGAVLVLLTNAYHGGDDFEATLETFVVETLGEPAGLAALAEIVVLSKLPEADLPRLYRRADVVALPTRGEGWGRPHVEAMACGAAVAATAWSGPTAYLDESNGYPIRVAGLADPAERRALGAKARADMVARFSPAELAAQVNAHPSASRPCSTPGRRGGGP
ncbi:glycosyl transferase [Aureococcus anophagefferens]|nr:glycosyl transferase [Aureococcus anophagefferens]